MATLTSTKIKNTYDALLKATDNDAIGSSAKQITDGLGNGTPLYISTTQIGIGVTPEATYDLHVYSNAKVGGNLTVTGDLTVEGTTTTIDTQTLTVEDPLIEVASNNTSTDAVDIGFYGKYAPSGTTLYAGLFRDTGDSKFKLFRNLQEQPTTTVNTSGTGYTRADLIIGNLEATQVDLGDDEKIRLGDSQDLEIYHNSATNQSFIRINGELELRANTLQLKNYAGETYFRASSNGAVRLYYDGSEKLITTTTGISVTDTVSATTFSGQLDGTISSTTTATTQTQGDNSTKVATTAYVDSAIGGQDTLAEILANGNTTGGTDIAVSTGDDITFADSSKSIYGAGSDLQIYHDGSNSYINDTGTGLLKILTNGLEIKNPADNGYMAFFGATGAAELYFNTAKKFETTSTGVSVTGDVVSSAIVQAKGFRTETGSTDYSLLTRNSSNTAVYIQQAGTGNILDVRYGSQAAGQGTSAMSVSSSGNTTFTGNIDINGNNKHIRFVDTYGNWLIEAGDGANNFKIHSQSLAADYLTLEGGGQLNLGEYGSGSFTGTATYRLAVDSSGDVIEIPIGGGAVDGSGTANYVTKWSDTDTITNSIIYDNGTNVGIGTITPDHKLRVNGDARLGNLHIKTSDFGTGGTGKTIYADGAGTGVLGFISTTAFDFSNGSTSRVRIDSSGQVGIGTTSPNAKLDILGASSDQLRLRTAETEEYKIGRNSSTGYLDFYGTQSGYTGYTFGGVNGERMRIDSSGDLTMQGGRIYVKESDLGNTAIALTRDADEGYVQLFSSGTQTVQIRGNGDSYINGGNLGIGTTSPAAKFEVTDGSSSITLQEYSNGAAIFLDGVNGDFIGGDYFHILADGNSYLGLGGYGGGTTPLNITNAGNVGIGTTSPLTAFEVIGTDPNNNVSRVVNIKDDRSYAANVGGGISFFGKYNSTNGYSTYGQIIGGKTNATDGDYSGYLSFKTRPNNALPIERMRIDSNGKAIFKGDVDIEGGLLTVGQGNNGENRIEIGKDRTTNGFAYIDLVGDTTYTDYGFRIIRGSQGANAETILTHRGTGVFKFDADDVADMIFSTNSTERMRIDSSGNVLINSGVYLSWGTNGASSIEGSTVSNKLQFRTNSTDAMIIDSSQNVGIGTTTPSYKLHVVNSGASAMWIAENDSASSPSTNAPALTIQNTNTNDNVWTGINFADAGGQVASAIYSAFTNQANNYGIQSFYTRGSDGYNERLRITETGQVGIGTSSPSAKLDVNGEGRFVSNGSSRVLYLKQNANDAGNIIQFENQNGTNIWELVGRNNQFYIYNNALNTFAMYISPSNNNIGIGTSSPDVKLDVRGEVAIAYNATYGLRFYNDARNNWSSIGNNITGSSSANLVFKDATGEAMRLEGGKLGIGTTSPSEKLEVKDGNVFIYGEDKGLIIDASNTKRVGFMKYAGHEAVISRVSGQDFGIVRTSGSNITDGSGITYDFYVSGTGSVGIGTTSPVSAHKLTVNGKIGGLTFSDSYLQFSSGNAILKANNNVILGYSSNVYITQSGAVGIGVSSSAGSRMHVKAPSGTADIIVVQTGSSANTNVGAIVFRDDTFGYCGQITVNGSTNTTNYLSASDYRLKQDYQDFNGLDLVSNIPVYNFQWKKSGTRAYGVQAHELQEIIPQAVVGEKDGEEMQGVDYAKLTPVLLKAIQELKAEIETLKAQINN